MRCKAVIRKIPAGRSRLPMGFSLRCFVKAKTSESLEYDGTVKALAVLLAGNCTQSAVTIPLSPVEFSRKKIARTLDLCSASSTITSAYPGQRFLSQRSPRVAFRAFQSVPKRAAPPAPFRSRFEMALCQWTAKGYTTGTCGSSGNLRRCSVPD